MPDKFCKFCGSQHTVLVSPQLCSVCDHTTWQNPLPVAVMLQPFFHLDLTTQKHRAGILIGQRDIEPFRGGWGLIGGHIDPNDKDVISAAKREFEEETGLKAPDGQYSIIDSFSDSRYLLMFVLGKSFLSSKLVETFVPNVECSAIKIVFEPTELCFSSHTRALEMVLRDLKLP